MKATVIETGENVEVNIYCSAYYKEVGQGPDRRGWNEDELEFEPGPKMVSLDRVCNYLNKNLLDYIDYCKHGTGESVEEFIEDLRKVFE